MAEPASDPTLLFTPDRLSGLPPGEQPATPVRPRPRPSHGFFIAPPSLPSAEKSKYKGIPESTLTSEVESEVDEVIGQYREGNNLYYFARYKGGIAHKFPAAPFSAKFGELIKAYERKKEEGGIQPFDPSAHYIHPKSRVRMIVNISNKRATVNIKSARSMPSDHEMEVVPDSEQDDDDDDDDDNDGSDDEYDEDGSLVKSRRITRSTVKPVKNLPFSPRKTRSQKVFTIPDSDDEDAEDGEAHERGPTRRSTRTRKSVKVNLDADAYLDESEPEGDESDGYSSTRRSKPKGKKPKKVIRGKASRPAYGHFRVVADLEYDSHSDEDSAPLREHRKICEKCHRGPAHELLEAAMKKPKGRRKKKTSDDEFEESGDEQEKLTALGGWVRCLKCPVTAHWRCLASTQRDEILKAARDRDRAVWRSTQPQRELFDEDGQPKVNKSEPGKRPGLDAYQTTEFICGACMKGGICMGCMEVALEPDTGPQSKSPEQASIVVNKQVVGTGVSSLTNDEDVEMVEGTQSAGASPDAMEDNGDHNSAYELVYRCFTCKRLAHYAHLPKPQNVTSQASVTDIAHYYQTVKAWLCADCSSYRYGLDRIIAWRPYPPNAIEPPRPANEPPHYKNSLPREYLVKWTDRSYRRTQWVPHMWLVSTNHAKLKNFLTGGTRVDLLAEALEEERMDVDEDHVPTFEITATESRDPSVRPGTKTPSLPFDATPDAERRIPPAWKTVDRILDVLLWYPEQRKGHRKQPAKKTKEKARRRVDSEDDADEDIDEETNEERTTAFNDGEQPSGDLTETVGDWEARTKEKFSMKEIGRVVWVFIKWDDLGYDETTWDSPPRPEESGYGAFETALKRFIESRDVVVYNNTQSGAFDKRTKDGYKKKYLLKDGLQPELGQNPQLKLMPFQVDGFNWLCNNWWTRQHCILADEMGLGKTVQIATFIGNIADQFKAFPALVVVPNSTITNWVREFERWAPNLRVVPFYGEAKARDVIKKFELSHNKKHSGETGAKFHVLVTTYEALLNPKDFTSVFKKQPRWEVLVIDEGQRLKSDSSLLFRKLNELNSLHRIIMTGTPLNNNMRELFNLMNFLDPQEWHDLENLEKEHKELNEELVKQLHNRLRPYFLRRIKSEVLQLPPKNEVIVPVSMAPLQKEVYRSILSHNLEILNGLTQPSGPKLNGAAPKGRINNVLMQLRKCLQHPYLYAEDIEPRGLPAQEAHDKLIDGSAKLRFLKALLPKLKARGHRVLLFSQFVIALDVIEDFLNGEGHKYLRLDGNTKGTDRQKGMDEFNRPGSDVFVYLLTTRAGGVGINLFSADTVIIFDPDFNPHQDLQAIARAHRYGQQKTCLVFKLMVKDSAEERIVQVGKKKLVLDHLIVQKMDDEDSAGENVQSILTYGAKALFESEQDRDIIYTDQDVEKLIEKTEKEGDKEETANEGGLSFSFAKIWAADKDSLEEVEDDDQGDSWAQTLQKITAEREKAQIQEVALSGRGVARAARRVAVVPKQSLYLDDTPEKLSKNKSKNKSKSKSAGSDGSAYTGSAAPSDREDSDSDDTSTAQEFSLATEKSGDIPSMSYRRSKLIPGQSSPNRYDNPPLSPIQNYVNRDAVDFCGLCDARHGDRIGDCPMTDKSENLAEFREMLILHAEDEPLEQRRKAIIAIDETLQKRGHISLIAGQPIHLVEKAPASAGALLKMKSKRAERPSKVQADAPAAGPSKRASSPLPVEELKKKKARPSSSSSSSCAVCGLVPFHIVKDCPIVAQGPKSVSKEIKRLDQDPFMSDTVRILRNILSKQKKRELEQAQSHHSSLPIY